MSKLKSLLDRTSRKRPGVAVITWIPAAALILISSRTLIPPMHNIAESESN